MFKTVLLLLLCLCTSLRADNSALDASRKKDKSNKHQKSDKYRFNLAMCAIFQNEARWLKEWIEFHKLMGVQRFYLYNNLSTDDYESVLEPYVTSGEVILIDWPGTYQEISEWTKLQCQAYMDAVRRAKKEGVNWLAILDLDEFLFPVVDNDLNEFLASFPNRIGVVVNWQMYGTSNVTRIPSDKLMIESLILKAPSDYPENVFLKSIVRPKHVTAIRDPHHVIYEDGKHAVNSSGQYVRRSKSSNILIDRVRINHYWSRDEDFFYNVKCPRRQKWKEGLDGQLKRLAELNKVPDDAILRFAPALREKMGMP